jgi:hypothetical protein
MVVDQDKKILAIFVSVPVIVLIIVYMISKITFGLSLMPNEEKILSANVDNIPQITERKQNAVASLKNPLQGYTGSKMAYPAESLAELMPPFEAESKVTFIMVTPGKKMAIIDGRMVREGDSLKNYKVVEIYKDRVLLTGKGGKKWLKVE